MDYTEQYEKGNFVKTLVAPVTYVVMDNISRIDVDTSSGFPTVIQLQPIDGSNIRPTLFINDISDNAGTGNIIIQAASGNLINNQPFITLDIDGDGAQVQIVDKTRFLACLNSDTSTVVGATGATGATGAIGATGATGATGAAGNTGTNAIVSAFNGSEFPRNAADPNGSTNVGGTGGTVLISIDIFVIESSVGGFGSVGKAFRLKPAVYFNGNSEQGGNIVGKARNAAMTDGWDLTLSAWAADATQVQVNFTKVGSGTDIIVLFNPVYRTA